jgi:glycerophosphoryl diester phosphodiesterase
MKRLLNELNRAFRGSWSNIKCCKELVKRGFVAFLIFEIIYNIAATYVIVPFASWIVSTGLRISGMDYITHDNFLLLFIRPIALLSIIAAALILTIAIMLEISFLTVTFNQSRQNKQLSFSCLLVESIRCIKKTLRPKNYTEMLFVLIFMPLSDTFLLSSLIGGIRLPNYILTFLDSNKLYEIGAIFGFAVLYIYLFKYLFVFNFYILEDNDFKEAKKRARDFIKGRKVEAGASWIIGQLFYYLLTYAIVQGIILLLSGTTKLFYNDTSLYSLLLINNTVIGKTLKFILGSVTVVTGYGMVAALLYKYIDEDHMDLPRAVEPDRPIFKRNGRIATALVLLASFIVVLFVSYTDIATGGIDNNSNQILLMAHRGATENSTIPENTMPAFEKALEQHADYIELDVQETSDKVVVVYHDSSLKRCTGQSGHIWSKTFEEVESLNPAYKYGSEYQDVKIPTLREVMEYCKGKIKMNIELKSNQYEPELEELVASLIDELDMKSQVVVISLKRESLEKFKSIMPDILCGYIVPYAAGDFTNMNCADFFSIEESTVTEKIVSRIHAAGKTVNVWNVDTKEDADKMISYGVDSFITDDILGSRESILSAENPLSKLLYAF